MTEEDSEEKEKEENVPRQSGGSDDKGPDSQELEAAAAGANEEQLTEEEESKLRVEEMQRKVLAELEGTRTRLIRQYDAIKAEVQDVDTSIRSVKLLFGIESSGIGGVSDPNLERRPLFDGARMKATAGFHKVKETLRHIGPARRIQVFSDVDDTIMASGPGATLAGCDESLPKSYGYPGVGAFFYAIARGRTTVPPEGVILLSARPDSKFSAIKPDSPAAKALQSGSQGIDIKDVLYGRKRDVHAKKLNMFTNFAMTKVRNLRAYKSGTAGATTAPGCDYSFVGDNGQGDALAAEVMLSEGLIRFAFVHVVTNDPVLQIKPERNLFFFDNYATAAEIAFKLHLISEQSYDAVLHDVHADLHDFDVSPRMVNQALQDQGHEWRPFTHRGAHGFDVHTKEGDVHVELPPKEDVEEGEREETVEEEEEEVVKDEKTGKEKGGKEEIGEKDVTTTAVDKEEPLPEVQFIKEFDSHRHSFRQKSSTFQQEAKHKLKKPRGGRETPPSPRGVKKKKLHWKK